MPNARMERRTRSKSRSTLDSEKKANGENADIEAKEPQDAKPAKPAEVERTPKSRKRKASDVVAEVETTKKSNKQPEPEQKPVDEPAVDKPAADKPDEKNNDIKQSDAGETDAIENEVKETEEKPAEEVVIKEEKIEEKPVEAEAAVPMEQVNFQPERLGKGKRARIPNKRYSDILLSPSHKNAKVESGEADNEVGAATEALETAAKSPRTGTNSPTFRRNKIKPPTRKSDRRLKAEPVEEIEPEAPPAKQPAKKNAGKWNREALKSPTRGRRGRSAGAAPAPAASPTKQNSPGKIKEKEKPESLATYLFRDVSFGYTTLLHVFQYLKVHDLLRAGCVCTMWRDVAGHPSLWKTVRMKNSQLCSFDGLANTLKKHGTTHLDLRKVFPPRGDDADTWLPFAKAMARVDTLTKIDLCRCPAFVLEQLATTNPKLEIVNALSLSGDTISTDSLKPLRMIKELKIKSVMGLGLSSNLDGVSDLITLKYLALTSIRDLHAVDLTPLCGLPNLESLDLGDCTDFPPDFGERVLLKLENLDRLRLEKGQGGCHTFEMLKAVKNMKKLEQLELINFDIKADFDKALAGCANLRKLFIIPTYVSQSATTNHMVLAGVLGLHKTLSHFVWGVTLELLRVTELFVDQCEGKEKKPAGSGDSIPVLKPVPQLNEEGEVAPVNEPSQVEILPLPNLQKILLHDLPTTRVKILKIPFHATWRQTITDSY